MQTLPPLNPPRRKKRRPRPLRNALLIATVDCIRWFAGRMPHSLLLRIGTLLSLVIERFSSRSRAKALLQLERTGMGATPAERQAICRGVFREIGMNTLESLASLRWSPEEFRARVRIPDRTYMNEARAMGKGVIYITGHMGNWELLPRVHNAYTGEILSAVMADTRDPQLTRWLVRRREAGGRTRVLLANQALSIMRCLRQGGTIGILGDQDSTRSRGIFVNFFGRPAYTPSGPAQLSRSTGAPLLPVAVVRDLQDPTRHTILIDRPILPDPALDEEADIHRMTQAYTSVLEKWIRQRPEQWVWVHDRWRHKPGGKVRVRSAKR